MHIESSKHLVMPIGEGRPHSSSTAFPLTQQQSTNRHNQVEVLCCYCEVGPNLSDGAVLLCTIEDELHCENGKLLHGH